MLRFEIFENGQPAKSLPLEGAYLLGSDHVPVRGEFELSEGELKCQKRAQGPAALAILWPVEGVGTILLETTRLPERERPYNLHLELARAQMMRICQKREDWGLFDIDNIETIERAFRQCQELLVEAIKCGSMSEAAKVANDVLRKSVLLGEQMSLFHAGVFLNRRRQLGQLERRLFGCRINPKNKEDLYRKRLINGFDFVYLPVCWRQIEPKQGEFDWDDLDEWIDWLTKHRIPIKAGPLVSFDELDVPDWLYIYEHDFEAIRDFIYEHIRRVVERFGEHVQAWDVISGVHAHNTFNMNFEQLIELTRLSSAITKQMAPEALTVVDLVAPWGEYYSRNPRTIPPLLYADMIVQNSVNFDALGLQFYVGAGRDGMYVRDMFQLSSMIDRFASFGKPVHITAVQAPSNPSGDEEDAWSGQYPPSQAGRWHDEWSDALQSRWLREFYNIALSKPFVETITWRDLADAGAHYLPHGGLLRADLSPKLAYEQLCTIRAQIHADGQSHDASA